MGRYARPKQQELKILNALHERLAIDKENPTMGFRLIRRTVKMGTDTLSQQLKKLVVNGYAATTTIGAYKQYHITKKGINHKDTLQRISKIEDLSHQKPRIERLGTEQPFGPTATLYLKGILFSELENIIVPAWNSFVSDVRKELQSKNVELGLVGTIIRPKKELKKENKNRKCFTDERL